MRMPYARSGVTGITFGRGGLRAEDAEKRKDEGLRSGSRQRRSRVVEETIGAFSPTAVFVLHPPSFILPTHDPDDPLQLFALAAGDAELGSIFQPDRIITAGLLQKSVDLRDADDRRSVDAEEHRRIETLFESMHPFPYREAPRADVNLGIRAGGGDVVDLLDGHDAHLTPRFDGDSLEILRISGFRACTEERE